MKRIPYYYAVFFQGGSNQFSYRTVLEKNSHPFIFQKIQQDLGRMYVLLSWTEITKEEFDYYAENIHE